MNDAILTVDDLHVSFSGRDGVVHAVNGVSFDARPGEVVAIVGESGSGKTLTALSIARLVPNATVTGAVRFRDRDLLQLPERELRQVRGAEIGFIFQDPIAALDPVQKIGRQIAEVFELHQRSKPRDEWQRAISLLDRVGIAESERRAHSYPHQLSGGMCQRVMIAMAIACEPALVIADEPTTALDVTVQADILDLLLSMRDQIGSTILLITHDVGIVAGIADRVLVMYAGRVVETGTVDDVLGDPQHPYTRALLAAVPRVDDDMPLRAIRGAPPSAIDLVPGCAFHPRCGSAMVPDPCAVTSPPLENGCACHLVKTRR